MFALYLVLFLFTWPSLVRAPPIDGGGFTQDDVAMLASNFAGEIAPLYLSGKPVDKLIWLDDESGWVVNHHDTIRHRKIIAPIA